MLRRELAAAKAAGNADLVRDLSADYAYDAVDTRAVDGMCATACPVLINTGDLVKRLRAESSGAVVRAGWRVAARHWAATTWLVARGLDVATRLPAALPGSATRAARAALGADRIPQWTIDLPAGGRERRSRVVANADAVFVPSCLGSIIAPAAGGPGVADAVMTLAERAGVRLRIPEAIAGLCCGTPWSSKGLPVGYATLTDRVLPALLEATEDGRLPIVSDATSCTEGYQRLVAPAAHTIRVIDAVDFVARSLLPRLTVTRRLGSLALHPTCSSTRLHLDGPIAELAAAVADEVVVPDSWRCCGFAGDRGLLHPELTASATRREAHAVSSRRFDAYASVNRTCELGLSIATGVGYRHLIELVEQATRVRNPAAASAAAGSQ